MNANPKHKPSGSPIKPLDIVIGGVTGLTTGLLANSITGRIYPSWKEQPSYMHTAGIGAAALIGAGIGAFKSALRGTGYDYDSFTLPRKSKDDPIIIAFSGGNGGNWQKFNPDAYALDTLYGKGSYRLFSYEDQDLAEMYLRALPNNVKVHIIGHSLGGPAAYNLAQFASSIGRNIEQLDTVDPVGKALGMQIGENPPTVKTWNNYYPKTRSFANRKNSNYIAVLGGAFDRLDGANNIETEGDYANHKTIRFALPNKEGVILPVPQEMLAFAGMNGDMNMNKSAEEDSEYNRLPEKSYREFVDMRKAENKDREYTSSVNALGSLAATVGIGTMVAGDKRKGSAVAAGALGGMAGYHASRLMSMSPAMRLLVAGIMAPVSAGAMYASNLIK